MKIKYIFLLCFIAGSLLCLSWAGCGSKEERCAYLDTTRDSFFDDKVGSFQYCYAIAVCDEFEPITKEMEEYVQSIKNIEGKNLQEVVTDIGNKLCRGFFCEDQEDIFYRRFEKACDNAFQTAQEETNEEDKTINITNPLYRESYTACIELAEKELSAFKKVAGKEATVYHKNSIETSTNTYAEKAWEMISDLANVMGTTIKKFSVIAQHVEGFIRNVYNTGYTVGNA